MVPLLMALLAFGALAVDVATLRLAVSEAQDIADVASQAALITYKSSGSASAATQSARVITSRNTILGQPAELLTIDFGTWDEDDKAFTVSTTGANAARATVGRTGDNRVPMVLGGAFGWDKLEVQRVATSSTRSLQVLLIIDITGSWHQKNFAQARAASLAFLDILHAHHGGDDTVGMGVYFYRYGHQFTPFTSLARSAADRSLVRAQWEQLNVGSYAGIPQPAWASGGSLSSKHVACKVFGTKLGSGEMPWINWCTSAAACFRYTDANNWAASDGPGGCYPAMPRYYWDEAGTDHTTGLGIARVMLQNNPAPTAYRALIFLTDGQPNGYGASEGVRGAAKFVEPRFLQYKHTGAHTTAQIQSDTVTMAQQLYADFGVHIWTVSFVAYDASLVSAAQGDGYFSLATSSSELTGIFEKIAQSLPLSIVQ